MCILLYSNWQEMIRNKVVRYFLTYCALSSSPWEDDDFPKGDRIKDPGSTAYTDTDSRNTEESIQ